MTDIPETGGQLTLLELAQKLPSMDLLPPEVRHLGDTDAIALGWGRSDVAGVPPCMMRSVRLELTSASACAAIADPWGLPQTRYFCTVPRATVNTCDGDSGGPVYRADGIGITVAGFGCGPEAAGINIIIDRQALRAITEQQLWPSARRPAS